MLHLFDPSSAMHVIYDFWALWLVSWLIAAFFAARTIKRSPFITLPIGVVAAFLYLLRGRFGMPDLTPLWHLPDAARWTLALVVLAGMAFAWWARITLGRLWSGSITLKPGHHIVDTGPYGLVRHPIYTGLLFATAATVAAQGSGDALVIGAAIAITLSTKAWAEERFLARELGEEAYAAYRRRVPMLVPFWPKSP